MRYKTPKTNNGLVHYTWLTPDSMLKEENHIAEKIKKKERNRRRKKGCKRENTRKHN